MCRQRICFWLSTRGPEPLEAVLPRAGPSPGALSPAGSTGSGRCSESWSHSQLQDPPDSRPCSEKNTIEKSTVESHVNLLYIFFDSQQQKPAI